MLQITSFFPSRTSPCSRHGGRPPPNVRFVPQRADSHQTSGGSKKQEALAPSCFGADPQFSMSFVLRRLCRRWYLVEGTDDVQCRENCLIRSFPLRGFHSKSPLQARPCCALLTWRSFLALCALPRLTQQLLLWAVGITKLKGLARLVVYAASV